MKLTETLGATSRIWQIFIADSSSTTGGGLTGLVFNTASLTCYYHRDTDTTATAVTLVTMTVGTFTSSGFKEIDATNMPGWYQLCPPNAVLASGAKSVAVHLKGATNMAPLPIEVQLVAFDTQDATALGLSRLDAAVTTRMATYTQPTGFLAATFPTTVASTTNITAGTITTVTTVTNLTNAPTAGDFTATMKTSIGTAVAASAVASVTGAVTVGTNNDKTGYTLSAAGVLAVWDEQTSLLTTAGSIGKRLVDDLTGDIYSRLGAPAGASVSADVASVQADTTNLKTRVPAALVSGRIDASVGAMAADTLTASALATDAVTEIVTAVFARAFNSDYAGRTFDELMKILVAESAAKVSGMATGLPVFRSLADTKDVISATVDVDGNRTSVTLTP